MLHPQYSQFGKLCSPQVTCITTTKGSGSECILCLYGTDKYEWLPPFIFQRANEHQDGVSKNFFLLECDTRRSTRMRKLRTAEEGWMRTCTASALWMCWEIITEETRMGISMREGWGQRLMTSLSQCFHCRRVFAGNQFGKSYETFRTLRRAIFQNALVKMLTGSAWLVHHLSVRLQFRT